MKITTEMLLRQLGLMARSAAIIAREPSRGRGARRLVATRGRNTVTLRLPWLPFVLIEELDARVGEGTRVFEFGGGGSTLYFLDRGAEVVTVENDPGWMTRLDELVGDRAWVGRLQRLDEPDAYVHSIDDYPDSSLDVVVVDGRERARCALAALPKVAPGGWLVFDDVDRERYAAALASIPWPRRDFIGFAPAKPSLAFTAVFERPIAG